MHLLKSPVCFNTCADDDNETVLSEMVKGGAGRYLFQMQSNGNIPTQCSCALGDAPKAHRLPGAGAAGRGAGL